MSFFALFFVRLMLFFWLGSTLFVWFASISSFVYGKKEILLLTRRIIFAPFIALSLLSKAGRKNLNNIMKGL